MYFHVICLKIIISLRYGSRTEEPSGGNISRCLMRKTLRVRKINVTIGQCWIPFCRSTSGKLIFSMLFFLVSRFYEFKVSWKSTCNTVHIKAHVKLKLVSLRADFSRRHGRGSNKCNLICKFID